MLLELSMTKTKSSGKALQGFSGTEEEKVCVQLGQACNTSLGHGCPLTHCFVLHCCLILASGCSRSGTGFVYSSLGQTEQQREEDEGPRPHRGEGQQLLRKAQEPTAAPPTVSWELISYGWVCYFVPAEKRFSNRVRMEMLHHFTAF